MRHNSAARMANSMDAFWSCVLDCFNLYQALDIDYLYSAGRHGSRILDARGGVACLDDDELRESILNQDSIGLLNHTLGSGVNWDYSALLQLAFDRGCVKICLYMLDRFGDAEVQVDIACQGGHDALILYTVSYTGSNIRVTEHGIHSLWQQDKSAACRATIKYLAKPSYAGLLRKCLRASLPTPWSEFQTNFLKHMILILYRCRRMTTQILFELCCALDTRRHPLCVVFVRLVEVCPERPIQRVCRMLFRAGHPSLAWLISLYRVKHLGFKFIPTSAEIAAVASVVDRPSEHGAAVLTAIDGPLLERPEIQRLFHPGLMVRLASKTPAFVRRGLERIASWSKAVQGYSTDEMLQFIRAAARHPGLVRHVFDIWVGAQGFRLAFEEEGPLNACVCHLILHRQEVTLRWVADQKLYVFYPRHVQLAIRTLDIRFIRFCTTLSGDVTVFFDDMMKWLHLYVYDDSLNNSIIRALKPCTY